jgi:hypothetical protein
LGFWVFFVFQRFSIFASQVCNLTRKR